jgi:hypothetical protein
MMRRTFLFDVKDDKAVAKIMKQYRLKTKSAAVRLALKMVVNQDVISPPNDSRIRSAKNNLRTLRRGAVTKRKKKHVMVALGELVEKYAFDADWPEDMSENLDKYLYGSLRPKT